MSNPLMVKICGITREADAEKAADLGASAVGLNFYERSSRYVDMAKAEAILNVLLRRPLMVPVAVVVETPLPEVVKKIQQFGRPKHGGIKAIQWHGALHKLVKTAPHRLISAFGVRDQDSLDEISRYLAKCREKNRLPFAVLLDAHVTGEYGGTGQQAPWDLIADFHPGVPVILAGGLTPESVADAIRIVRPWGVDVASGVEASPGIKDAEKMKRFINNAREAAARLSD